MGSKNGYTQLTLRCHGHNAVVVNLVCGGPILYPTNRSRDDAVFLHSCNLITRKYTSNWNGIIFIFYQFLAGFGIFGGSGIRNTFCGEILHAFLPGIYVALRKTEPSHRRRLSELPQRRCPGHHRNLVIDVVETWACAHKFFSCAFIYHAVFSFTPRCNGKCRFHWSHVVAVNQPQRRPN